MAELQESLHDMRRELEHSQSSRQMGERTCRQLEAQLEDSQRKYDDVFGTKLRLENSKLELELQVQGR